MQILHALVLAAVAIMDRPAPLQRSEPMLVRQVLDGDTIEVSALGRVRLLGIEAPKTAAPFGREARDRLAALVLHRWVRLEQESPANGGRSRRPVYVVREDGVFVNAVLLREGLARVSLRTLPARLAELQSAEREAQAGRRGIWGVTVPRKLVEQRGTRRKVASERPRPLYCEIRTS